MAAKAKAQITLFDITDAYSVILTSEAFTFVGNTSGAPSGLSCTTQAVAYCGATKCSKVTIGTVSCPTGISATVANNGGSSPTITFKTTATVTAACEATIPVTVNGVTINKKFSFAVAKTGSTGATGATGPQGPQGPKGNTGATGATGPQGPQGVKGDKGNTGATGPQGPTGPQGADGDSLNYSNLKDSTASKWGFTADATADGHWYTVISHSRDKYVSDFISCLGSKRFRVQFQMSTSCQANTTNSTTTITKKYVGTAIGLFCYNDNKVSLGISYSTRVTGSASAPVTNVDCIVTTRPNTRYFRIFLQTEAWNNFSGTIKIRNLRVSAIDALEQDVANAAKTATNYMKFENNVGLIVGDMTKSTLGNNVLIDSDSVDIRSGSTVLASYGKDYVYIGKNSGTAKIDLCSGAAKMYNEEMYEATVHRFVIEPQEWLYMSGSKIGLNTYYDDASTYGEVDVSLDTWSVSGMNYHRTPGGNFQLVVKTGSSTNSSICNYAGIGVSDTDLNSDSGSAPLRLYKGCSHANYSSETSIDLYNNSFHINGNTWAHGLISCEGILYAQNNIEAYQDIGVRGDMWFTSEKGRFYVNKNGVQREAMNLASGDNGDMSIGWTNYDSKLGVLYIGGTDIYNRVANTASKTEYRPYYRKGDSITIRAALGGYATSGGKAIYFVVPLTKPVIGNPTVSVASVNGLILRQNNSYPHSSSSWCKPASYTAQNVNTGIGVGVLALFNDNSGVTNNSPIGVDASLKITFS